MKSPRKTPAAKLSPDTSAAGNVLLAALEHPLKREIAQAREWILGVDPIIAEGVKWNAPSFRTSKYFATTHLRSTVEVQFIFHLGAKVRKPVPGLTIADPAGIMKWLAKDRALLSLGHGAAFDARRAAFQAIVRQWIAHV